MTNGKPKMLDLISEVRGFFIKDTSKTAYWDFIEQFKEHLQEVDSSYNKEIVLRIFDDYKRQMDAYVSNRWNEDTVDWAWDSARIAETLKQLYEQKNKGEYISYFYDSLRKELNKIPTDNGTLARIEEYFVEVYIKNALDELYGIVEHFMSGQNLKKTDIYKTDIHVLAYILDCDAVGKNRNNLSKEEKGNIPIRKEASHNTKYKRFNYITENDINSERFLIELAGDTWKDKVLELSSNPVRLSRYLKDKGF